MVLLGGLNPVALAQESGIEADNMANSGIVRYEELAPFAEAARAWASPTVAV
jgi:repressor of nif and glnA expression